MIFGGFNCIAWAALATIVGVFEQAWDVVIGMALIAVMGVLAFAGGLRMVRGAGPSASAH
jgi:hypothetical protein